MSASHTGGRREPAQISPAITGEMPAELGRLVPSRKAGSEPFHADGRGLGFDLESFWRWMASDTLRSLEKFCRSVTFAELRHAVEHAAGRRLE